MKISVALRSENLASDACLTGVFEGEEKAAGRKAPDAEARRMLDELAKSGRFSGSAGCLFSNFFPGSTHHGIILAGLGPRKKFGALTLRKLGSALYEKGQALSLARMNVDLDTLAAGGLSTPDAVMALAEGIRLREYCFDRHMSNKKELDKKRTLKEIRLVAGKAAHAAQARKELAVAEEILASTNFIRALGDEPANVMTPGRLAEEARKMARSVGLKCRILDETEIRRKKMGGLLSVAKGSKEPPRFIILEHRGGAGKPTVLVGKGITFDSGGISIKPSASMDLMRYDMCGGAAVIGVMRAAAKLKLKHHIVGLVPTCENLPSGTAQRPGDIHTTYAGKTVEVLNTDAEGRLILSDALAYAQEYKPRAIIDLATLTGAVLVALADQAMGLMTNDRKLGDAVIAAGEKTGERCWALPMWEEYGEMLKSAFADLKNIGSRYGGTITAAKFLENFVGDYPWVHLDIAGVAWRETPAYFAKSGATGAGVRLLVRYFRDLKK